MDILGIGNALLDIFYFSDEESSLSLGLHPNHAAHVSPERLDELLLAVPNPIYVSGGSASNAVKAASALGARTAFIGCTGTVDREDDHWARMFRSDLASFGVSCVLEHRNAPSGRCLVIHMPGGLKAVACAPGAAPLLRTEQIDEELLGQAKTVLLDGQVLRNKAVTDRISHFCRTRRIPLAIDISTSDIARNFSGAAKDLLINNETILFLNTDEALTLALALENTVPGDKGIQNEEEFIDSVFSFYTERKKNFPCIIEKRGENGARAWASGAKYEAAAEKVSCVLDDTGAGDVFAGAFLCAYLRELSLSACLAFANTSAREALFVPGSSIDRGIFRELTATLPISHR